MVFLQGVSRLAIFAESLEMTLLAWLQLDIFDLLFVVTAVVFNIQIIGIYIARQQGRDELVKIFGLFTIAQALPLAIVFINHLWSGSESWIRVGFTVILFYLIVELLLDFIYKVDFRGNPALHIPYILLFYGVEFSLIAIAFSINTASGYLVSFSFWTLLLCLIAINWPKARSILLQGE